jgi:hypothetical protein
MATSLSIALQMNPQVVGQGGEAGRHNSRHGEGVTAETRRGGCVLGRERSQRVSMVLAMVEQAAGARRGPTEPKKAQPASTSGLRMGGGRQRRTVSTSGVNPLHMYAVCEAAISPCNGVKASLHRDEGLCSPSGCGP